MLSSFFIFWIGLCIICFTSNPSNYLFNACYDYFLLIYVFINVLLSHIVTILLTYVLINVLLSYVVIIFIDVSPIEYFIELYSDYFIDGSIIEYIINHTVIILLMVVLLNILSVTQ